MKLFFLLSFILTAIALSDACGIQIGRLEPCTDNFRTCNPVGASNNEIPNEYDWLAGLFYDLIGSIGNQPVVREAKDNVKVGERRVVSSLCCDRNAECRVLRDLDTPYCWDPSTTSFYLSDGSSGNLFTGYYTAASGAIVNLRSGDSVLPNGEAIDIYSKYPESKPPSTLNVATPRASSSTKTKASVIATGAAPASASTGGSAPDRPALSSAPTIGSYAGASTSFPVTSVQNPARPSSGYGSSRSPSSTAPSFQSAASHVYGPLSPGSSFALVIMIAVLAVIQI